MNRQLFYLKECNRHFFLWLYVIILIVLVSSCSSSEENGEHQGGAKTARLSLKLSGKASVRSTGASLPDNESTIQSLVVGLFYGDGSVNTIVKPTMTSDGNGGISADDILCSPGTCDVIAVANVDPNVFTNVQTKNEFIGKTVSLSQTSEDGRQTSDHLPMSGISKSSVNLEAGKSVSAEVNLSRLVARISISSIRTAFSLNNADATFTLDRIFLCNALETSFVSPGDVTQTMPAEPTWLHGGTVKEQPDGSYLWTKGTGYLLNDVTPEGGIIMNPDEYIVPYWFYAFANNSTSNRTKLVLSGYFDPDGAGPAQASYVYYPIVVNQMQTGTVITPSNETVTSGIGDGTISRNRNYRIKAVIKGDGEPNPGGEIQPSSLDLTVQVDDWTLEIVQEVEVE